ncbi:hypothetical protein EV180_007224, partial [Coemansia sp. RSA 518]
IRGGGARAARRRTTAAGQRPSIARHEHARLCYRALVACRRIVVLPRRVERIGGRCVPRCAQTGSAQIRAYYDAAKERWAGRSHEIRIRKPL